MEEHIGWIALVVCIAVAAPIGGKVYSHALADISRDRRHQHNTEEIERIQQVALIRAANRGETLQGQNTVEEASKISAQTPIHYPGWRPDPERRAAPVPPATPTPGL